MAVTSPSPTRTGGVVPASPATGAASAGRNPATALVALLLVAMAAAAFSSGATGLAAESRVQMLVALGAVGATAIWLWRGVEAGTVPGGAVWGVVLLVGFAAWNGVSLAWSVAPDRTWIELNRAIAYAIVAGLGVLAAAIDPRARQRLADGFAVLAALTALYALGGKFAPGFHIGGVIDLDNTGTFTRLRAPLGYWNALALFCVLGLPLTLRVAVDAGRRIGVRLAALASLELLLVTLALTYSRGGVLALAVAIAVALAFSHARLRSLAMLGLAVIASAPAIAYGLLAHDLTTNGLPLSEREHAAATFGLLLFGALLALMLAGRLVLRLEASVAPDARRSARIGATLGAGLVVVLLLALVSVSLSGRGLVGTIDHQAHVFTTPRAESQYDPAHLLATNSGNRWVWWTEAAGAFSDRPVAGWGAGSFPVVHREYRKNRLDVLQPHSVPLQFLSETGIVGFGLAAGGLGLLLWMGIAGVRRLAPGHERELAAALLGASIAWLVHGLYDWDWDIPAVSFPALAFVGMLAARPRAPTSATRPQRPGRVIVLAAATLVGCTVALSSLLPAWSDAKAGAVIAELGASSSNPHALVRAERSAELASRLNPLEIRSLLAAATAAAYAGRPQAARAYLLRAVERQPSSVQAWLALASLGPSSGDRRVERLAIERALELDPESPQAPQLAAAAEQIAAPPQDSATAAGTPLSP